jgi:hypothetical protein
VCALPTIPRRTANHNSKSPATVFEFRINDAH